VIAQEMRERGVDAAPLEVYHSSPSIEEFDLVVAPVHLSPENLVLKEARRLGKEMITHHRAVGELLADDCDFRIFEVTGTHSKTSTALLLSKMLSYEEVVVSHSTRGIELWDNGRPEVLMSGLSITPANVIHAFKTAHRASADSLISEVSLGGTGLADFGILTSFANDYKIAGGSSWASQAKLQMVSLAKQDMSLIANLDTMVKSSISIGLGGDVDTKPGHICVRGDRIPFAPADGLDLESYSTAISAAAAAALCAGLDREMISEALDGFDGLSGRMKKTVIDGLTLIDNSNSGLTLAGVKRAIGYAKGHIRPGLVVGEDRETVCEGMDIQKLVELLVRSRDDFGALVLVGERLEPYASDLRALPAANYSAGVDLAKKILGSSEDCIIACVKCFR
jgi:UDP-N-acetylmuramyl pentapeptide synthase